MARSLEDALKKKSESEPQTPIISSAKALGLAYQAKLESFQADQLNPDSDNKLVRSQFFMACFFSIHNMTVQLYGA